MQIGRARGIRIRTTSCALSVLAGVLSTAVGYAQTTEAHGLGTTAQLSANDGLICTDYYPIGGQYPDNGVLCRDRDGHIAGVYPFMTSLEIMAIGDGNRIWGIHGHQLMIEANGFNSPLAELPEPGEAQDLVLVGNSEMATAVGLEMALDFPVVLMKSGNAYYYFFENDPRGTQGWHLLPHGPWIGLSSIYSPRNGFAFPSLFNGSGEIWEGIIGLQLAGTVPQVPVKGTGYDGRTRYAVGGRTTIGSKPTYVNTQPFFELNLTSSFDLEWKPLPCYRAGCSYETFGNPPKTEYIDFDPISGDEEMCDAGDPGCGVSRLIGGAFGFDYYSNPLWKVHGFMVSSFGRGYVIVAQPPTQTLSAEWQNSAQQLPIWPAEATDAGPDQPRLVEVDQLGGPVYELPATWTEMPAIATATYKLPRPRESVAFDVFVPSGSAWAGGIEVSGAVPAAGVWDSYLGYRSLDALPRNSWVKVELPLTASLKAALDGDFPGARLRVTTNTGLSGVKLRGLRFSGVGPTSARPPHQTLASNVRSNAFLDFEQPSDWLGASLETTVFASHGTLSTRLATNGWTELESREFSTSELPQVGSRLSLDVFVPLSLPNPEWIGSLAVYLQCPSVGVWGRYLGQADLSRLFSGEWNSVSMPLDQASRSALTSGAHDCTLRVTVNTAQTDLAASFLLDHLGFTN